jgi:hypothetical protein
MDHHIHLSATPRPLSVSLVIRLNQLLAGLMMIVIISTTLLMWPITHLGFGSTFVSQEIFSIEPGSPAAQAGLRVGDRILMLYNHPIHEVIASVNVIDLIGPPDRPIPIVVQREEQVISAKLMQLPPPARFQATKLAMCSLALICWLTGYHLGVVRQHDLPGSSAIACFWLCIGGLLGSLLWAELTAFPIFLGQLWLM